MSSKDNPKSEPDLAALALGHKRALRVVVKSLDDYRKTEDVIKLLGGLRKSLGMIDRSLKGLIDSMQG